MNARERGGAGPDGGTRTTGPVRDERFAWFEAGRGTAAGALPGEAGGAVGGLAVLESPCGIETGVQAPSLNRISGFGGQRLQPHQDAAIRRAEVAAGLREPDSRQEVEACSGF